MPTKKDTPPKEKVTREEIKPQVIGVLVAMTQTKGITEPMTLWPKLRMGPLQRAALSLPFSKISAKYDGLSMSDDSTRKLKDVKSAIDLVYARSNGRMK